MLKLITFVQPKQGRLQEKTFYFLTAQGNIEVRLFPFPR